ncbi:MAG: acetolactate synthase small subunit [Spirochaetaceae bacterium]|nr:acetolactate synthase small subunit [Spirochaetaceae bacterium]
MSALQTRHSDRKTGLTEDDLSHILSVLVENRAGTLSRVSGLFSRRGFNIDSLTVGETENPAVSRMTIAVSGDEAVLEQIVKQLSKLVDVIAIQELENTRCIRREIMLVKVRVTEKSRPAVVEVAAIFRSRVIDISPETITVEATGSSEKLDGLLQLLHPYGILEMARTGLVALERGAKILSAEPVPKLEAGKIASHELISAALVEYPKQNPA